MRGRLLAVFGYLLAIVLGAYGLVGGYLRDYAATCEAGSARVPAATVEAFDDFCGNGPRVPPIPPHGAWGWVGLIGVGLGLIGLLVALIRSSAKTIGNPNISALYEFDPQPDPPRGPR